MAGFTQEAFTDKEKKYQLLTDEEKKEIEDLPKNFNIVKENQDYDSMAYRRVDISRETARKLLKLSLIFNCLSILFFIVAVLFTLAKPAPSYYASTPSGKVYGPLPKDNIK